ncbi:MAG: orotidine-5'-phosphate decarboxylase [Bacteroidetes bacterium]|nr:orotidine-5'-phosphate decarboxylase [Bacteroidota bacterium]
MTRKELIDQIRSKKSFLCVGLDPDADKLPKHLLSEDDAIFEFNKQIIDATADHCVAYKPNSAFYEAYGISGLHSLDKTLKYIKQNYPEHFIIADAKRGDIGNTASMYARAFFKRLHADAITVAPYMGRDSVEPFLQFDGKWAIVLGLTSNAGASDLQLHELAGGAKVYEHVLRTTSSWGTPDNMMYVIGATKADMFKDVRNIIPDHFILVPGVGAQGGNLADVCRYGLNEDIGLLVNASRSILYASGGTDFAVDAAKEAAKLHDEMKAYVK